MVPLFPYTETLENDVYLPGGGTIDGDSTRVVCDIQNLDNQATIRRSVLVAVERATFNVNDIQTNLEADATPKQKRAILNQIAAAAALGQTDVQGVGQFRDTMFSILEETCSDPTLTVAEIAQTILSVAQSRCSVVDTAGVAPITGEDVTLILDCLNSSVTAGAVDSTSTGEQLLLTTGFLLSQMDSMIKNGGTGAALAEL